MSGKRAITLLELLLALALLGVLVLSISSLSSSLSSLKKDLLEKQRPFIQGQLATATIFERILRSGTLLPNYSAGQTAYTISDGGYRVAWTKSNIKETIWQDGDKLMYDDGLGGGNQTLLTGVSYVQFGRPFNNDVLSVNIKLTNGETARTYVQPRNQFTPQGLIN